MNGIIDTSVIVFTIEVNLEKDLFVSDEQELVNMMDDNLTINKEATCSNKIPSHTNPSYTQTCQECTVMYLANNYISLKNKYGSYFYGKVIGYDALLPERVIAIGYRQFTDNISHVYVTPYDNHN